jgi:hypothetical protein
LYLFIGGEAILAKILTHIGNAQLLHDFSNTDRFDCFHRIPSPGIDSSNPAIMIMKFGAVVLDRGF